MADGAALMISGIIPDIGFGAGASFSGVTHNAYGSFASHVSDAGLGNFTGPLFLVPAQWQVLCAHPDVTRRTRSLRTISWGADQPR